jgi:hypothetical protein
MSKFLDDLFKKIFPPSDQIPMNLRENIVLKSNELEESEKWARTEDGKELFAKLYKNYHFKKAGINDSPQVHVFDSQYAKGFAITFEEPLTEKTFDLIFLAFAHRVLALGYYQVSLDRKMEEINEQVKISDKFYLKPPLRQPIQHDLISQLYGNILIEKIAVNNKPNYLKFLATFYSDRLYQEPNPFDQLLDRIFDTTTHG